MKRVRIDKNIEKSTVAGSTPVTNVSNELNYVSPGTLGQQLEINASGVPEYKSTVNDLKTVNRAFSKVGSGQATNNDSVLHTDNAYRTGNTILGASTVPSEKLQIVGNEYLDGILKYPFSATRDYIELDGIRFLHTSFSNTNLGIGKNALSKSINGYSSTAIGIDSLFNILIGSYNTSVGAGSLYSLTNGETNSAFGVQSLYSLTNGSSNTSLGVNALYNITTGDSNVAVGNYAGYYATGSSKLYIENTGNVAPLIGGDFSTNKVNIRQIPGSGGGMLNVNGAIEATAFNIVSDERTKDILGEVDKQASKDRIKKLSENSLRWVYKEGVFSTDFENKEQVGYTAQLYQSLYPNAVQESTHICQCEIDKYETECKSISESINTINLKLENIRFNFENSKKEITDKTQYNIKLLEENLSEKDKNVILTEIDNINANLKNELDNLETLYNLDSDRIKQEELNPELNKLQEARKNVKEQETLKITDSYKSIIVDLVLLVQQQQENLEEYNNRLLILEGK